MAMIPEEGSFSLSAYVTTPGYQTIIPRGYLVSKRDGETWIAPLIPSLFYGVDGQQLGHTWRQYLPQAGEQVILSRVAGKPEVPSEELWWRKVSEDRAKQIAAQPAEAIKTKTIGEWWTALPRWQKALIILSIVAAGPIGYAVGAKFRRPKRF